MGKRLSVARITTRGFRRRNTCGNSCSLREFLLAGRPVSHNGGNEERTFTREEIEAAIRQGDLEQKGNEAPPQKRTSLPLEEQTKLKILSLSIAETHEICQATTPGLS
jgi:hypothetical protein